MFIFIGYQFDLKEGKFRPTLEHWQTLNSKILKLLTDPSCQVRQLMPLIGLLTATEKQFHLGPLHMRLIQWHLKSHWRIPESVEKVIPIQRSLHPHFKMVAAGSKRPSRPATTPSQPCSSDLHRCLKRRQSGPFLQNVAKAIMWTSGPQLSFKESVGKR